MSGLLLSLITRHAELTGSPRARWVLENWEHMLPNFIKVFPQEYRRTLRGAGASACQSSLSQTARAVEAARG